MDSTAKIAINPADFCSVDELLDKLLDGVEFAAFPVEMIGGLLQGSAKVLDAITGADSQDVPHLAEVAREQSNIALALLLAWSRQQRQAAREVGE
jgi:hypothetical protein